MNHKPIQFKKLGLSFTHKTCFSAFSSQILYGDKIAIVGRNGSGKSAILQILHGIRSHDGWLYVPLQAKARERIAICGASGSGKSSLIKALLADSAITTTGEWLLPKPSEIGYLDQHSAHLDPKKTVLQLLTQVMPGKTHAELRLHLNTFLFRKDEEVDALTSQLSGGEKARLTLALIAAKPPALLILDELCNNLDYETKIHLQQVLLEFQGTLIVIAHEEAFLSGINIETRYQINQARLDIQKEVEKYEH